MLQKFNITTYAVALCLFAFMLFTAAPVFADPQDEFDDCKAMKWSEGKKDKKNCYRHLAEELIERNTNMTLELASLLNIQDSFDEACEMVREEMKHKIYWKGMDQTLEAVRDWRGYGEVCG